MPLRFVASGTLLSPLWRTHSCVPRWHSCRRPVCPQATCHANLEGTRSHECERGTQECVRHKLTAAGEDRGQFVRWNHFQLCVGAVARLLVRPPSSKVRHMPEARALHMLVSYFPHQLSS